MTEAAPGPRAVIAGEHRRWYVHLALLLTLAGSLVTLVYLSHSITIHVIFGVAFMVFVLFHLYQRRCTVRSLAKQFVSTKSRAKGPSRLAISDTILELLVANVLVSGIVDAMSHHATVLPFASDIGLRPASISGTSWRASSSWCMSLFTCYGAASAYVAPTFSRSGRVRSKSP
ncbi:MAG: hypothetical protein ACRDVC_10610 [Acidimicrobiales bacterium]